MGTSQRPATLQRIPPRNLLTLLASETIHTDYLSILPNRADISSMPVKSNAGLVMSKGCPVGHQLPSGRSSGYVESDFHSISSGGWQ